MTIAHRIRLAALLGVILALYFLVPVDDQARGGMALRVAVTAGLLFALAALVLAQVRLSLAVPDRHVDGLVGAIALVWAGFALGFYLLQVHHPHQLAGIHTRLDALYFAASTMLTVGYGDIHATGQVARALVLIQMAFDVVFVAAAASLLTTRLRRAASTARDQRRVPPAEE
ncbi:potassium channel family protein [Nocardioides sp. BP30]|uniref:potassium channel family protein n=1 Tax=Nocardioides sp. BP30 TaxID=3036374 RepID=UPI002469C461|nr:potassium channel family protein [Nocardioides sp. BP30]WGL50390.1 potassium channel family protein [Nocardioides sp. BP30]